MLSLQTEEEKGTTVPSTTSLLPCEKGEELVAKCIETLYLFGFFLGRLLVDVMYVPHRQMQL